MGCGAVATGHYVRREVDPTGRVILKKGRDIAKDQSYFLYDLTPAQLAAARFPVGDSTKEEVRAHARRAGLSTAEKPESQEICFVPPGTRAGDFVARHAEDLGQSLPILPGTIEDSGGRRLGRHEGHFRFTVGQRRGLQVAASERLYVLAIDASANRVVVGTAPELETLEADVVALRFPSGLPEGPFRATVRVRHRAPEVPATVSVDGSRARVIFDHPVRAVAPGQSCVFYDADAVIGGGVLNRSAPSEVPSFRQPGAQA
jgi:tRNA-specific 2-thiouridylase